MTDRDSDPRVGLNGAVAEVLNGERSSAGYTYDELADLSGINRQTLLRLLSPKNKERRHINVDNLKRLADVFHLTPSEVVATAQVRIGRPKDTETTETMRRAVRRTRKPRTAPVTEERSSS